jgi:sugar O-acyltransferase (sialic acid O-acetyltransferase NeuD family)
MKEDVLIIGAGGHALSCIDVLESNGQYRIVGLIGLADEVGKTLCGYDVIGSDANLPELRKQVSSAVIGVGQVASPDARLATYLRCKSLNFQMPVVVSSQAYVSEHAKIMMGTVIMHGAILNAGVVVGENCIINSRALLEHGVKVDSNSHIATGVILNGDVRVGQETFVGSGSIVHQSVQIGNRCVIGMGQIVRHNVESLRTVKHAY